jgi:nucleoside-diphosphate-sugar epimerase
VEIARVALIGGSGFIGFHLHEYLDARGINHIIFDKSVPGNHFGKVTFYQGDLNSKTDLQDFISNHEFSSIINLAARTDDSSNMLLDYSTNFLGVKLLATVLQELKFDGTFFQISSQYVAAPSKNGEVTAQSIPVNIYGESKRLAENELENFPLLRWTILRPTNVWGSHHPGFPKGFWKIVKSGLYFHPSKKVIRSYVYVRSLCDQIFQFLELPHNLIDKKTFYVSDEPIDSYFWVNEFSLGLTGKRARKIPTVILYIASRFGDLFKVLKIDFPITNKRYKSMTSSFIIDLTETKKVIEIPKFDFGLEVRQTCEWYLELVSGSRELDVKI